MPIPSATLTEEDARIIRALLRLGWAQHDVASLFGCNPGRVAEVATGARFPGISAANLSDQATRVRIAQMREAWAVRVNQQLAAVLAGQPVGGIV